MLSTSTPMQVSMVQIQSSVLTVWLVPALAFLDHLSLRLLQRLVDEMVDKGWIAKINILFDSTLGISYIKGFTLSVRLLRVWLERSLLYGFVPHLPG